MQGRCFHTAAFSEKIKRNMLMCALILALTDDEKDVKRNQVLAFFFSEDTRNRAGFHETLYNVARNSTNYFRQGPSRNPRFNTQFRLISKSVPQIAEMLEQYHNRISIDMPRTRANLNFLDILKNAVCKAKFFRDSEERKVELLNQLVFRMHEHLTNPSSPHLTRELIINRLTKATPERALQVLEEGPINRIQWDPSNRISALGLPITTLLTPIYKRKERHTGHVRVGYFE